MRIKFGPSGDDFKNLSDRKFKNMRMLKKLRSRVEKPSVVCFFKVCFKVVNFDDILMMQSIIVLT